MLFLTKTFMDKLRPAASGGVPADRPSTQARRVDARPTPPDRKAPLKSVRRRGCARTLMGLAALALAPAGFAAPQTNACPATLDFRAPRLQDDAPQELCRFAGKVILVVNTASYCGYTPQYEGLEKLHARYAARGFTVLGFPSNDFQQEANDSKEIAALCFDTYGVRFPMFAPSAVTGPAANPFHATLASASGQAPRWNFHKYLLDRQGRVVATFPSAVEPLDPRLTARIEQLLGP
jgi:glutathione peroxidase